MSLQAKCSYVINITMNSNVQIVIVMNNNRVPGIGVFSSLMEKLVENSHSFNFLYLANEENDARNFKIHINIFEM